MKTKVLFGSILLSISSFNILASTPENFLYVGANNDLAQIEALIKRPDISGVQVVYHWKSLEMKEGQYDFSKIEQDLNYLNGLNKKLFIQIQDRFFRPEDKNVPLYLMQNSVYRGGIIPQYDHPGENKPTVHGWVAQQWNPAVRQRYQKLLEVLAKKFDGRIYGINLPETAIDPDLKHDKTGFSCDKYFKAEIENLGFTRKVFKKSYVVQYVNFWPCEWNNNRKYMSRLFDFAKQKQIGLGGPDIVPNKKGQMKNAYPFFHQNKGKIHLVAMAIQEPTLTYINPKTKKPFTRNEFVSYAEHYLGVNIIFWSPLSPWLRQDNKSFPY